MHRTTWGTARLAAVVTGLALVTAACGEGLEDSGGEGELAGAQLTVGSKEFTEQKIVGQMAILMLEDAGATVQDETGLVGTATVRTALTSGEIDLYWEYTGTGWTSHLGHKATDAPDEPQAVFDQVAAEDLEQNNVRWFAMAPFENTYRLATTSARSQELGVTTMSEFAELANSRPEDASLCAATEFLTREDGWPGVEQEYGFTLPDNLIFEVDLGLVFDQVPAGDTCKFGEVFSTDGRIPANDLVLLEDDRNFFVKFNLAMTTMEDTFTQYPALEDIFTPLAEKLTTETMQTLNAQVDAEGLPPAQVAEKWLQDNGFLS